MTLRVVLHAPTAAALGRARSNALNLLAARPDAELEIVVNGPGLAAAIDQPHPTDDRLVLCRNTLRSGGRAAPEGSRVVEAAVLHLAERQAGGWSYIRA